MTASEMLTLLGYRLEDSGGQNFTAAMKYSSLNVAQRTVANFLNEAYLTELEFRDVVSISGTGGLIQLSGDGQFGSTTNKSTSKVIRNSIRNVQLVVANVYRYAIQIPFTDVKKLENEYLSADVGNPIFWVFGNNITFRPTAGVTSAVLYYLKEPSDISASVDCSLNSSLHDIIVHLAESELWGIDNNTNRSQAAKSNAMDQIKMLNARYEQEGPDELG
tara:strand:+ start:2091 stop:2747 length:657 start_codon:yes stop_codon:yes gene_type:complete